MKIHYAPFRKEKYNTPACDPVYAVVMIGRGGI